MTDSTDPSTVEWRRTRVDGIYLPDHQFLVVNRSQNGATGRNVVNALQLDDGSLLLVNRGFVPEADGVPALPQGPVEVVGRLRVSERRATGQQSDESSEALTEIRRIDLAVLSKQFDSTVEPMYVELLESTPPDDASLQPIVADTDETAPVVHDPMVHLQHCRRRLRSCAACSLFDRVAKKRKSSRPIATKTRA